MLFLWDVNRETAERSSAAYYDLVSQAEGVAPTGDPFAEDLFRSVLAGRPQFDELIGQHAAHWRIERMPVVDRNILRMAVCEMAELKTPPAIAIDEAIELARRFSNEESAQFVNGVLDAVRRDLAKPPD